MTTEHARRGSSLNPDHSGSRAKHLLHLVHDQGDVAWHGSTVSQIDATLAAAFNTTETRARRGSVACQVKIWQPRSNLLHLVHDPETLEGVAALPVISTVSLVAAFESCSAWSMTTDTHARRGTWSVDPDHSGSRVQRLLHLVHNYGQACTAWRRCLSIRRHSGSRFITCSAWSHARRGSVPVK